MKTQTGKEKLCRLFTSAFSLSACTFGGGFVIIPLMRRKYVEQYHWLEEQEMLDLTAIAQSAPGAVAVNAALLVGYRVAGAAGALLTVTGTVLPPLVILSLVSLAYGAFRDSALVSMAMEGMLAGTAAVICDVTLTMGKSVLESGRVRALLMMAGAFCAVRFWGVNIVAVLLVCALVGALSAGPKLRLPGRRVFR